MYGRLACFHLGVCQSLPPHSAFKAIPSTPTPARSDLNPGQARPGDAYSHARRCFQARVSSISYPAGSPHTRTEEGRTSSVKSTASPICTTNNPLLTSCLLHIVPAPAAWTSGGSSSPLVTVRVADFLRRPKEARELASCGWVQAVAWRRVSRFCSLGE